MLRSAATKSTIVSFRKAALVAFATTTPTPPSNTMTMNTSPLPSLRIQLLSENAVMPTKGSPLAAGWDLSASTSVTIPANGGRAIVPTDLSLACPIGTYGRIAPRSGLAVKHGIDVGAGVVDADYRGPVGVILFNFGSVDFKVERGDRIAQLILEQICMAEAVQVEELDDTERGADGFGSTGVQAKKMRTISPTNKTAAGDAEDDGNEMKTLDK